MGKAFGCLGEVILTHTPEGAVITTVGPTDAQRVQQTMQAMKKYGIKASIPESWGHKMHSINPGAVVEAA